MYGVQRVEVTNFASAFPQGTEILRESGGGRLQYSFTDASLLVKVRVTSQFTRGACANPPSTSVAGGAPAIPPCDFVNEFYLDSGSATAQISFPAGTTLPSTLSATAAIITPSGLDAWEGVVFQVPHVDTLRVVSGTGNEPEVKRVYVTEEDCDHATPSFAMNPATDTATIEFKEGSQLVMMPVALFSTMTKAANEQQDIVAKKVLASKIVIENASRLSNWPGATQANWQNGRVICDDGRRGISFTQKINYSTSDLSPQSTLTSISEITDILRYPTEIDYSLSPSTASTKAVIRVRKAGLLDLSAYQYLRYYLERGVPSGVPAGSITISDTTVEAWSSAVRDLNYLGAYGGEVPDFTGIAHGFGGRGESNAVISNYTHARLEQSQTFSMRMTPELLQKISEFNGVYYLTGYAASTDGVRTEQYSLDSAALERSWYAIGGGRGVTQVLIAKQAGLPAPQSRTIEEHSFTLNAVTLSGEASTLAEVTVATSAGVQSDHFVGPTAVRVSSPTDGDYYIYSAANGRLAFILSVIPLDARLPEGYPELQGFPTNYLALTVVNLCERSQITGAPQVPASCSAAEQLPRCAACSLGPGGTTLPEDDSAVVACMQHCRPSVPSTLEPECWVDNLAPVGSGILWHIAPWKILQDHGITGATFTVYKQEGGQWIQSKQPRSTPALENFVHDQGVLTDYEVQFDDSGTNFRVRQNRVYNMTLKRGSQTARELTCVPDENALKQAVGAPLPGGNPAVPAETQSAAVTVSPGITCMASVMEDPCSSGAPRIEINQVGFSGDFQSALAAWDNPWFGVRINNQWALQGLLSNYDYNQIVIDSSTLGACLWPQTVQLQVCDFDPALQQSPPARCYGGSCSIQTSGFRPPAQPSEQESGFEQPATIVQPEFVDSLPIELTIVGGDAEVSATCPGSDDLLPLLASASGLYGRVTVDFGQVDSRYIGHRCSIDIFSSEPFVQDYMQFNLQAAAFFGDAKKLGCYRLEDGNFGECD